MFLYKDNRFHFNNISFCLPDNVYLNTACEEYDNCIELCPADADFRIVIFTDFSEVGAKQFFAKGEAEACYRWVGEITSVTIGNLHGYSLSYKSAQNAYTEYRFDTNGNETNVLGIFIHVTLSSDIEAALKHPSVVNLLQSLKAK